MLEFIHSSGWGGGERLFEFDWEEEGVGAYSRLGAYKLFLPLGWALIRISTVLTLISVSVQVKDNTESFILHFFFAKIVSTVIYTERG